MSSGPVVLAQVQLHMEASAELAKVTAPRNLAEWKKRCAKVTQVVAEILKKKPTAYCVLWTARTWLKAKMAGAGVRRLSVPRIRLNDLLQSWPDCKGHLARLGEGQRYVQWLFDKLGYDGPAECFTMWCCLFNDRDVRKIVRAKPDSWLRDHRVTLRDAAAEYRAANGMWPHPAVLLQKVATKGPQSSCLIHSSHSSFIIRCPLVISNG